MEKSILAHQPARGAAQVTRVETHAREGGRIAFRFSRCGYRRVRALLRLFFEDFPPPSPAASSRRFLLAHPGLFTCLPRAIPSASAGTLSVIAELAATYAPSPIFTGAIKMESLPMNTRFPIVVGCFAKPS